MKIEDCQLVGDNYEIKFNTRLHFRPLYPLCPSLYDIEEIVWVYHLFCPN